MMNDDNEHMERILRGLSPRRMSGETVARICAALSETPATGRTGSQRFRPAFWVPAAAVVLLVLGFAGLLRLGGHAPICPDEPSEFQSRVSHVEVYSREHLGRFTSPDGAPVEVFLYPFTVSAIWTLSDGSGSVETAVPLEAVVCKRVPVF